MRKFSKLDPLQDPKINLLVHQADQEAPVVKRRAATQAYCQMLIDLYRRQREKAESDGPSLGIL